MGEGALPYPTTVMWLGNWSGSWDATRRDWSVWPGSLDTGQAGICRARGNRGNGIIPLNYGKLTSMALDPVEKKPLRRFSPGSMILSVGSFGCNLKCPFCQNHEISMAGEADSRIVPVTPKQLAEKAADLRARGNIGVAYTYNEPMVGWEFVRDTARLVRGAGMKNVIGTGPWNAPKSG